jgi:hypothetical protein
MEPQPLLLDVDHPVADLDYYTAIRPHDREEGLWQAPPYVPPSNQTLSLFQYYAVVMGSLRIDDAQQQQPCFLDQALHYTGNDVYNYIHGGAASALRHRMRDGTCRHARPNRLFLNAMRGILSDDPEAELLGLFRELHADLAIDCACP